MALDDSACKPKVLNNRVHEVTTVLEDSTNEPGPSPRNMNKTDKETMAVDDAAPTAVDNTAI